MKLDPGIHIVMHSVFFLKPGVTCRGPSELVWRTAASTAARQAVRIAERRGEEEAAQRSRDDRRHPAHDSSCRDLAHMRPAQGGHGGRRTAAPAGPSRTCVLCGEVAAADGVQHMAGSEVNGGVDREAIEFHALSIDKWLAK